MGDRLELVVDASVLVAAFLRAARVRKILMRPGIQWVAPRSVREEIRAKAPVFAKTLGVSEALAVEALDLLLERVAFREVDPREPAYVAALRGIGHRDPSDVPVLALALRLESVGIWSLDKDFDGIAGMPRLTTAAVERIIDLVREGEQARR